MKKKIVLTLAALMTASALAAPVSAAEYTKANLLVNGKAVVTDQSPVIVDGRTLVPVRVIAESLGSKVDWDANTKTVTFTYGGMTAAMEINGDNLKVTAAGKTQLIPLDVPATIINSRTMVPVRFLSETFGYKVDWDANTKTVLVSSNGSDVTTTPAAADVATSSAAAEGMADKELKDDAMVADGYAAVLNNYTKKMSKAQSKDFEEACDKVATVLKTLDMGRYTAEEITAGKKAVDEAKAAMEAIAKELKVDLTPVQKNVEDMTTDEAAAALSAMLGEKYTIKVEK